MPTRTWQTGREGGGDVEVGSCVQLCAVEGWGRFVEDWERCGGPPALLYRALGAAAAGSVPGRVCCALLTSPLEASCHFWDSQLGSQLELIRRAMFPLSRASIVSPAVCRGGGGVSRVGREQQAGGLRRRASQPGRRARRCSSARCAPAGTLPTPAGGLPSLLTWRHLHHVEMGLAQAPRLFRAPPALTLVNHLACGRLRGGVKSGLFGFITSPAAGAGALGQAPGSGRRRRARVLAHPHTRR